ncbi:hypothetical protein BaRGS_00016379, partial [Batillaria attramentaria]
APVHADISARREDNFSPAALSRMSSLSALSDDLGKTFFSGIGIIKRRSGYGLHPGETTSTAQRQAATN